MRLMRSRIAGSNFTLRGWVGVIKVLSNACRGKRGGHAFSGQFGQPERVGRGRRRLFLRPGRRAGHD